MPSKDEISNRLRRVLDPEIGMNVVDLNMVRGIEVVGGNVIVTVALTVQGCPMSATISQDVQREILPLDGVASVQVVTTTFSPEELEALRRKLATRSGAGKQQFEVAGIDKLDKNGIRNAFAVVSGKGGVGKSFVTCMLATELRRQGHEVGILDADLTGPSVPKVFGLTAKPEVLSDGKILPVLTRTGIKVMSVNLLLDEPGTPTIWRGPTINNVIRQLYHDVEWGSLHYLLVDLPPGTSDATLTVFQSLPIDGVVVVTTPQELARLIVSKSVNMAKQMKVPIEGIVENMSYYECLNCSKREYIFGDSATRQVAEKVGIPFLGDLPVDPEVPRVMDRGDIEGYRSRAYEELVANFRRVVLSEHRPEGPPIAWSEKGAS